MSQKATYPIPTMEYFCQYRTKKFELDKYSWN